MRIADTIHHGDYYNVREVRLEPDYSAFVDVLNSGPYGGGSSVEPTNKYAFKAYRELIATGEADFGWRRFEVLDWEIAL